MNNLLKKVIKGLECHSKNGSCGDNCPYETPGSCSEFLCADALTLLKAHEPRVMTLEELENYKKPVWIEERESPKASKWYAPFKEIDSGIYVVFGEWCFMVEDYNTEWRPWTDVPTDEQRKAVKWDD